MEDKIINAYWFTNKDGCIGIVLVNTEQGLKAYIGQAKGEKEQEDIEHIAKWGAKFTLETILDLFNTFMYYGDADSGIEGLGEDINSLNYKLSAE